MDYDENVIAMMNAATPEAIKRVERVEGVLTIDVGLGVGTVPAEVFDGEDATLVTEDELSAVEAMGASFVGGGWEYDLTEIARIVPRLARAYRRVCTEREALGKTVDMVSRALVAKGDELTAAKEDGRRAAIEEAARYLRLHAHDHAANIAQRHEAELIAKGPARGE